MEKIWKKLHVADNYEVSNTGEIRNKSTGKIIAQRNNGHGYLTVHLYNSSKRKVYYVHRLVASAFLENKENKPEVNHINGDKTNNNVSNLEWCTRSENSIHAYRTKLRTVSQKTINAGRKQMIYINNSELRKIALQRAAKVNRNKSQNEYILNSSNQFKPLFCEELHRVFLSARRVEQKIGIKRLAIQKAMQKGYKTCGGYHWKEIKKHRFNNYGR